MQIVQFSDIHMRGEHNSEIAELVISVNHIEENHNIEYMFILGNLIQDCSGVQLPKIISIKLNRLW